MHSVEPSIVICVGWDERKIGECRAGIEFGNRAGLVAAPAALLPLFIEGPAIRRTQCRRVAIPVQKQRSEADLLPQISIPQQPACRAIAVSATGEGPVFAR